MEKFKNFLKKKDIEFSVQRYLIDALSYMALALFSTLIIGSIINQIGIRLHIDFFTEVLWPAASSMTAPTIAVAVAYALKAPPLVMFASAIGGVIGGDPVSALIAGIIGAEFGKIVSKSTKLDIIVTPAVTVIAGGLAAYYIGPVTSGLMNGFGQVIMWSTEQHPIPMGILVSVLMGIALTLPISSAAIGLMLGLSGLAAGAATVGCASQMVGFAVMSYKENGVGGLFAQGVGTSMLQMGNIVKNPFIWIPPILTSAILGPIATTVFKMENVPYGSGMGTSGLVGQFGTLEAMGTGTSVWISIVLLHFLFPAIITQIIAIIMRKKNFIKDGDLKLME
ncbi:PTS sugar transporter subunit IIC [Alkalibaculum sp. M08DMB]|uniref:PTS sugar transporter subunit IIC n=1 Tax=Alkalibaculum sporogenes TaxID=2655001 RepID=A0A6A7K714_9FIRM|nr:PTS sugar transporter subunit IIC [Alkalibaculum sporogenes]MPW24903.1 PTS sugar transporter subunit IIC [Alkalibaculum sporogenes]